MFKQIVYPLREGSKRNKETFLLSFVCEAGITYVKKEDFLVMIAGRLFATNYKALKGEEYVEWLPLTEVPDFVFEIYKSFIHMEGMDDLFKDFLASPFYLNPHYLLF